MTVEAQTQAVGVPASAPVAPETAPAAPPAPAEDKGVLPPKGPDQAKVRALLERKGHVLAPLEKPPEPAPEKPAEGDSKLALRLAQIAREDARLRAERQAIDARKPHLERLDKFEQLKAKDKLEAMRSLLSDEELESLYENEMTDWLVRKAKPVTREEQQAANDKALEAKLRTMLEAERASVEAEQVKGFEAAQQTYVERTAELFKANASKFPLVSAHGVAARDILSHTEAERQRTGQVPHPEAVLAYFEQQLAARIEAAGYVRKVEAPRDVEGPRSQTVSTRWTSDASSPPPASSGERSLKDEIAAIKRRWLKS